MMNPGEPLLLCRSTFGAAIRFSEFIEESGVAPRHVLSSILCAMPLPIYTDFGPLPDGRPRRRWDGVRAEFMWHPLMWLPRRVSGRYTISDPATGVASLEDDDLWAIRVAFEMTASGLYDPETGTWLDVLATVGLDTTNDVDLARVEEWLDGADDEVLDSIDLSEYLDVEPPSWALESALALRGDLTRASWALIADDLLDTAEETRAQVGRASDTEIRIGVRALSRMAESLLTDVPAIDDDGLPIGTPGESHHDYFARVHGEIDVQGHQPDLFTVSGHLDDLRDRFAAIREAYWPSLDALSNLGPSPEPVRA